MTFAPPSFDGNSLNRPFGISAKGGRAGPLMAPHTYFSLHSINVCADWRECGKFLSCKLAELLGSLPPKLKACVESRAKVLTARKEGNGGKGKGERELDDPRKCG